MKNVSKKSLVVEKLSNPVRLDKFLIEQFPFTSRQYWKAHLKEVSLNGKPAKKGAVVRGGETLRFAQWPTAQRAPLQPNTEIKLPILYEDDFLLAVDKPAGLPCLPLKSDETETVINALLAQRPEQALIDPDNWEAGLIHRLDNDTTGVLLFAKTPEAKLALKHLNQTGKIEKTYQCWVHGLLQGSGKIDIPIAHHPKNKKKMMVVTEESKVEKLKARPAQTQYKAFKTKGDFTLLEVKISKGARHQIRIHLASLGHPIVGDRLYYPDDKTKPPHHLLHAYELKLIHPGTGEALVLRAMLPDNFN